MLYGHSSQNDKDKNFPDFGQQNSQDLLNMMGNLDIGRNNENIFNPSQNDDNQHSLNQAFNQLSQGNFNPFESFGNPMANEPLNTKQKGKNQNIYIIDKDYLGNVTYEYYLFFFLIIFLIIL